MLSPESSVNVSRSYSDWCGECNIPMCIQYTGAVLTCPECGKSRVFIQATSNRVAFGEEVNLSTFTYKRQGHLEDILTLFHEGSKIGKEDLEDLMYVLYYVGGVQDAKDLTPGHVKDAYGMMKRAAHYRRLKQQLFYQLCGYELPMMSQEMQTRLLQRFAAIQPIFEEVKPEDRQHFIRYRFYAYKGCELEGADHFLPFLPLLKGQKNVIKLDQIFARICEKIDWEFIPTKPLFVWLTPHVREVEGLLQVLLDTPAHSEITSKPHTRKKKPKAVRNSFYVQEFADLGEEELYNQGKVVHLRGRAQIVHFLHEWLHHIP